MQAIQGFSSDSEKTAITQDRGKVFSAEPMEKSRKLQQLSDDRNHFDE